MGVHVSKLNPRPAPGNIGGCYLGGNMKRGKCEKRRKDKLGK
jgi:hypothetical protein